MVKHLQILPNVQGKPKFPKSCSLTSLKTQAEVIYEKDLITRKISEQQKRKLISLITADNFTMKDAAKFVNISYSTAKKVFSQFRYDLRESMNKKAHSRLCKAYSEFTQIQPNSYQTGSQVFIVSLVAGIEQIRTNNIVLIANYDC